MKQSHPLIRHTIGTIWTLLLFAPLSVFAEEAIDASDPTKIYTYMGVGPKYNRYTNTDDMWELRAIGNWGLSDNDMLLFEFGYGWHGGKHATASEKEDGFTNSRLRYFHTFEMNYEQERGYRGLGLQVDLQLAGDLRGTDGQNQLMIGAMPTFALGGDWNLYLITSVANSWDKGFGTWNGAGASVTSQFIWDPEGLWPGAQFRIIPTYTYFVAGDLKRDGSGQLELNVGGEFTSTLMWDLTFEKNFDVDLNSYTGSKFDTELENDWSLFFNVTKYF